MIDPLVVFFEFEEKSTKCHQTGTRTIRRKEDQTTKTTREQGKTNLAVVSPMVNINIYITALILTCDYICFDVNILIGSIILSFRMFQINFS